MTAKARALPLLLLLLLAAIPVVRAEGPPPDAMALLRSPVWKERVEGLTRLREHPTPDTVGAVARLLRDPDWEVGITAAGTLGSIGGRAALDALVAAALRGEIQWVRDAAAESLRSIDATAAANSLLHRVQAERETAIKVRALDALGQVAPAAVALRLRPWIRHRDLPVAAAAVRALGRIAARHPETADEAVRLLEPSLGRREERKHFRAYAAAIDALGHLDHPYARFHLVRELLHLPDDDPYVPTRIARHLRRMDPVKVALALDDAVSRDWVNAPVNQARVARLVGEARIEPYVPWLTRHIGVRDERTAAEAVRSLGRLGATSAADPGLLDVLEAHESPLVRIEAVIALATLLEAPAFRTLLPTVQADPNAEIRRHFVTALHDAGDPLAIPTLAAFVRDADWRVATAAIASIGTLGVARDLPLLLGFAGHRDWKIRGAAYEAMGRLRAARAIPHLIKGLGDADPVVRGVCHANLQILSRERFGPEPAAWSSWYEVHGKGLVLKKRSRMTPDELRTEEAERSKTRYAHDKYRFERRRGVEILQKARILVVSGAWDHVERVLEHLEIPHTALRAQRLKEVGINPNQVILVNCEGNVDRDAQERLRWFVNVGGYLMTTDWALTKTVEPCFPGYIAQYSGANTGNDVVVVEDALPGHPFTAGVFDGVPALMWWLEVRAFPITVTYPERCDVIVDSAAMRQRYGSSPMATVFRWGLGKVQHSISHFYLQEEGMQRARRPRDRMIFAADHLGLSLDQIRRLAAGGQFEGQLNEATMREIAPDYSMFRLIVNVVKEKSDWVEGL